MSSLSPATQSIIGRQNGLAKPASILHRFATDEAGALGMFFALAIIPMLLVIGMATDYGRASAIRTTLQEGLDLSVLEGAKAMAVTADAGKATKAAKRRYTSTDAAKVVSDIQFQASTSTGTVTAKTDYDVPMTFLALVGYNTLKVTADAAASAKPPNRKGSASQVARKAAKAALPQLSENDIQDLVYRVDEACNRLAQYGLDRQVPQCQSVYDGTFERQLRAQLASNRNVDNLLPNGVRLLK
ncbi:MAG: pilus assembly protein TadG-related protein [Pseudomonadota bacterium]